MRFKRDTAVVPSEDGTTFSSAIAPGWDIGGNANGGYLLAIAGRAMLAASGRVHPISMTAHYLAPGRVGPVTIETEIVKSGRRFTTVVATMRADDGRPVLQLLGSFGDLTETDGPEAVTGGPPELPPPDECRQIVAGDPFPPPLVDQIDMRIHPVDAAMYEGRPVGTARFRGWFRLRDGEPLDALALLLATDVMPPATFNLDLPIGWTPTLELTTHVRSVPADGWLRCVFTSRFITGGFMEEDGEIFDETGRLVAQSRQLALVASASL